MGESGVILDLEREYSPSTAARNFANSVRAYGERSVGVLTQQAGTAVPYGDQSDEFVWLAGDISSGRPIHLFIHGGYWQELSWRDATFPAPDFANAGFLYGAISYSLAPSATLPQIVEQCRRAVAATARASLASGGDGRISLSGSSAGAHLAASCALTDWNGYGLAHDPIAAVVLLSGVYDLTPLIETSINEPLGLDADTARALSPLFMPVGARTPALISWGEHETRAFKDQSLAFASHWAASGLRTTVFETAERDHFDVVFDLADPAQPLGRAVIDFLKTEQTCS